MAHAGHNTTIEWGAADAVAADDALTQTAVQFRPGNLVLAEQAQSHGWTALPAPAPGVPYWPELPFSNPAYTAQAPPGGDTTASAADMLAATGAQVQPGGRGTRRLRGLLPRLGRPSVVAR